MELHEVVLFDDELQARPPPSPRWQEAPTVVAVEGADDRDDEDTPVKVPRESGGLPLGPTLIHTTLDDVMIEIRGIQADQREHSHKVENQIRRMSLAQTTFFTHLDSI
ncbi:hypothetical protein NE237_008830 [Protea cynaroides]|uniref:Uncharacterized protein n=1 Tax=Protea cynaroides TaxID=273540 RepID=A0A9Q0KWK2_9MAGN|nr:hypothetical protein NE237_008830 [Protea cynaroides]